MKKEKGRTGESPPPPRSREFRESCDGLSPPLTASGGEERAIAENSQRGEMSRRRMETSLERKIRIMGEERIADTDERIAELEEEYTRLMAQVEDLENNGSGSTEDENKDMDPDDTQIRKLRPPDEVEGEEIASKLVKDKWEIREDAGAYACALIEKLTETLTDLYGNRASDEKMAVICANMIRSMFRKMEERTT